jgi:putative spermidine/putrescine transport system ATP-binding protein
VTTGSTVEFRALSRAFGPTRALDDLTLTVQPGELLALLGPSGCGKTTALRTLAGFEHPDSGQVLVDGQDITQVPAHRRDTGMVFQSYSLFPHLTARDNVAFGLRVRGVRTAERHARAAELLELVGLPEHGDRYPHQLSGGQQQRIALARALALRPRVLLLDEPLSALDAKVRVSLREEIRRLQQELGITTLFVTHDQEEALSVADRVAVLRAGRVEQCAAPADLYQRPATAFVAEFVGTMNRIPGTAGGDRVQVLGRALPISGTPVTGEVDVLLRPEAVTVTPGRGSGRDPGSGPEEGSGTGAGPALGPGAGDGAGDRAVVLTSSFLGATTRLTARLAGGTLVKADLPTAAAGALVPGTEVTLTPPDGPVLVAARVAAE